MTQQQSGTRTERDTMGTMEVPANAYWGASTQRAVLNFPVSNLRYPPEFNHILGAVKRAAARVNAELGLIDKEVADAIVLAATEVVEGKWDAHFVVDLFQTGSGTSTNTNANEVIARRAREVIKTAGKNVHPNDDVNRGQSSNDVIPTATHLTAAVALDKRLLPALASLEKALMEKSREFWPIIKTGRTHLQDATPIRLGQEFLGFAQAVKLAQERLRPHVAALSEVALGGTAVGTGVNAHPEFASKACAILARELGIPVKETPYHFQAQATQDALLAASGAVRAAAVSLQKIANDLRWLSSGPRAGLGELELPTVQPGSSIMPGKVNPVIAESLVQVVCQVIGNDAAVAAAAQGGYLELNTYWPVAAYNMHQAITVLASATANFEKQCVVGIKATSKGPEMVEQGLMLATGLTPAIGYDRAAALAKEAAATGRTIRELAKEKAGLSDEQLRTLLDPARMTEPGVVPGVSGGGG
ncbi:MAG: class II fumarate hydratase [SAR202 cluster bacterium]|nr:class II fumarate hydratase [SAR202 cluster bacterium]